MNGLEKPMYPRDAQRAFTSKDRVWLCLTTLHHRRFVEDAVHMIGLPKGAHLQLRYRRKYVHPDLWAIASEVERIQGCYALVMLCATDDGTHNVVRPLRKAKIHSARCLGSILVLQVTLEEFLVDLIPTPSTWNEIQLCAKGLPAAFGPDPQSGFYLQELTHAPQALSATQSVEGWEYCAGAFFEVANAEAASANAITKVPFLYFLALPHSSFMNLTGKGSIDLEAGTSITAEVHTMTNTVPGVLHNPLGEILLELSHPAATFSSSRRVRVDSRRDVRGVRISTPPLFRRAYGHLSVRTVLFADIQKGPDELGLRAIPAKRREETVMARYDFPLRIGRGAPILASFLVAAAAGLATYKGQGSGGSPIAEWVPPALVMLLAFIGLVMGFRKEGKV